MYYRGVGGLLPRGKNAIKHSTVSRNILEKKTGINFYWKNKYAHDAKFVKPHKVKFSFLGMKALR